ncbi:MAG: prepilin-type N-terminal cleavage/methylation domain-containing protein [Prosthecobacter sp.]
MKTQTSATRSPIRICGFSLVEALIVVAIIGAFSAMALAYLGGYHREVMLKVRDRRNAQEITALAMGATAAGASVVIVGDMESTIQNLIEGRKGTVGTFKGRLFRITQLTQEEIAGALEHLEWQNGMPSYVPGEN